MFVTLLRYHFDNLKNLFVWKFLHSGHVLTFSFLFTYTSGFTSGKPRGAKEGESHPHDELHLDLLKNLSVHRKAFSLLVNLITE